MVQSAILLPGQLSSVLSIIVASSSTAPLTFFYVTILIHGVSSYRGSPRLPTRPTRTPSTVAWPFREGPFTRGKETLVLNSAPPREGNSWSQNECKTKYTLSLADLHRIAHESHVWRAAKLDLGCLLSGCSQFLQAYSYWKVLLSWLMFFSLRLPLQSLNMHI